MITTASLVFDHDVALSLSQLDTLSRAAAARQGLTIREVTEVKSGLFLACDEVALSLDLELEGDETRLTLTLLNHGASSEEDAHRCLAGITHAILVNTDASFVMWLSHKVKLPRAAFLSAFGDADADTTRVQPRRVTARPTATRARRAAVLHCNPPANISDAPGITRLDAHILAYETHLRDTLLREASEEELAELRLETGIIPIEARLSTWAVSLAVATVSLPVAVPVMIYNVARGEDMRVASLAMGLAGLFVALDSSGAMAGIMAGL